MGYVHAAEGCAQLHDMLHLVYVRAKRAVVSWCDLLLLSVAVSVCSSHWLMVDTCTTHNMYMYIQQQQCMCMYIHRWSMIVVCIGACLLWFLCLSGNWMRSCEPVT